MNGINTYYQFVTDDKNKTFYIVEAKKKSGVEVKSHGAALEALTQIEKILTKEYKYKPQELKNKELYDPYSELSPENLTLALKNRAVIIRDRYENKIASYNWFRRGYINKDKKIESITNRIVKMQPESKINKNSISINNNKNNTSTPLTKTVIPEEISSVKQQQVEDLSMPKKSARQKTIELAKKYGFKGDSQGAPEYLFNLYDSVQVLFEKNLIPKHDLMMDTDNVIIQDKTLEALLNDHEAIVKILSQNIVKLDNNPIYPLLLNSIKNIDNSLDRLLNAKLISPSHQAFKEGKEIDRARTLANVLNDSQAIFKILCRNLIYTPENQDLYNLLYNSLTHIPNSPLRGINQVNDDGQSALIKAVVFGKTPLVNFLLAKGADVNISCIHTKTVHGGTALNYALIYQQFEIAKRLISEPKINLNNTSPTQYSGLAAVLDSSLPLSNKKELIELMLKRKADPNKGEDVGGMTPLQLASSKGYDDIVDLLLNYGANPRVRLFKFSFKTPESRESPLALAAKGGHLQIFKKLFFSELVQGNVENLKNAFTNAIRNKHYDVVEFLLKNKVNPNYLMESPTEKDVIKSPLIFAINNKDQKMVQILRKYGAHT